MTAERGIRVKDPVHPGNVIRHEVVEAHGLSVGQAAEAIGVGRPALSQLLNERTSLTPEMAIRIEKAFGLSMETLLRMQLAHDIAQAWQRFGAIDVQRYKPGHPEPPRQGSML